MRTLFAILLLVLAGYAQEIERVDTKPDTIRWKNYANGKQSLPKWADGQVYINCNFSQLTPHTKIGGGKKVTFIECNLLGCDVETNGKREKCYQVGHHKDYCSHEHKEWASKLAACPVQCKHVIPESTIVVLDKGDTLAVQYLRKDLRAP